jgi:hypothetical protein
LLHAQLSMEAVGILGADLNCSESSPAADE